MDHFIDDSNKSNLDIFEVNQSKLNEGKDLIFFVLN